MIILRLTVFFENPFWVCVIERNDDGIYDVCKITFGAEPKDSEVYDFMLKNFRKLKFSQPVDNLSVSEKHISYKRMQREVKKQVNEMGICTKAQQSLKLQQELNKQERKSVCREQREAEKKHQFKLHQKKMKEKHRGH